MDDGSKTAAGRLAAKAARQKQALNPASASQPDYDIAGELLSFHRHFLKDIDKQAG
jgi:hypothetical protein